MSMNAKEFIAKGDEILKRISDQATADRVVLNPSRARYSLFSRPLSPASKRRWTEPGPCGGSIINTAVCKQAAD